MQKCPKCGRAMASVLKREGGLVRMYYDCPACPPASGLDEGGPLICAICHLPIEYGSGRYRTEAGDVHKECYERKYGKPARPG